MVQTCAPRSILTHDELVTQFTEIGIEEGQTIILHASLNSLGFVIGGAEIVIRALLKAIGEEGTLVMPSQTWKNLDPEAGVHWEEPQEWWPMIRAHWPAYDKDVTPAIGMGVIAEMLRKWPGAARSDHPARSFAAVGKHAAYITKDHDLGNIFGDDSPLDRIYRLDGSVLLIGVDHDKNTSLHLAESRAMYASKRFDEESSVIMVEGKRTRVSYTTLAVDDADFIRLGHAYEQAHAIPAFRIGDASVRLLKQRPLVDWAVLWMESNRV
jgi:aminoglycoside 3-N-acetyltransferase